MTFERLLLHNFGAYRGQHVCALGPISRRQPIILIGGLNGAGKSTIMDAIQLALFGKLARCAGRVALSYDEFLRRSVHRNVVPQEARVQLDFVSSVGGTRVRFSLDRSWTCTNQRVREHFEVRRNDLLDQLLTDSWLEHVDEWLPTNLSQVFFFDGEQLEALADAATSAAVLRSSVEALLGLDLVSRLTNDLTILERRKDDVVLSATARGELEALERRKATLAETRSKVKQELGAAENALEECIRDLKDLESELARSGGNQYERRHEFEAEHKRFESEVASVERELRELADGPGPLLLVCPLLDGVLRQSDRERASAEAAMLSRILDRRDRWLLEQLEGAGANAEAVQVTRNLLDEDRKGRRAAEVSDVYLDLPEHVPGVVTGLRGEILPRTREALRALNVEWNAASERVELSTRGLAAIPSADALSHLLTTREERRIALDAATARVNALKTSLGALLKDEADIDDEIQRYRRVHRDQSRESENALRTIDHIGRVHTTLSQFRSELLKRHASRIEELALDSLRQLLRKEKLVSELRIDPDSFGITLKGADGHILSVERLSAGERQLLATALLWGLRRAAGRVVPLVIDTPLGRLDSSHRMHLVSRYFPQASHQTVLLSTDEEISGRYYDALRPWIATEYTIITDEVGESAKLTEGYFNWREPAGVA